jgi:NAD-dependent dihydropyrimidine dehydrogenase PreA subunit
MRRRAEGVEWRGDPGYFIRIDPASCDGCGDCLRVCLGSCFTLGAGKAEVKDLGSCMECAACWYACERGAIILSWPRGGTGFATEYG